MQVPDLKSFLEQVQTIAVVGISANPDRPSHQIAKYFKEKGYKILPVNPAYEEVLGEKCYASLSDLPQTPDIVQIFRRSEAVLPIVEQAVSLKEKSKLIWMQTGIENQEAFDLAEKNGIPTVMNLCLYTQHKRLFQP